MGKFPGILVSGITSDGGDSIDTKVKTLIWDSPKGDYTRRKERVFSTYIYIYIYIYIHICTYIYLTWTRAGTGPESVWCSLPSGNPFSGFWLFNPSWSLLIKYCESSTHQALKQRETLVDPVNKQIPARCGEGGRGRTFINRGWGLPQVATKGVGLRG